MFAAQERAGGLVSRSLTKERTSLNNNILQALVFISFNMPSVQYQGSTPNAQQ